MTGSRRARGVFCLVGFVVAAVGCSSDNRQKTYPVTGQVVLDDKPLGGVTVVFVPVDKSKFKWDEQPKGRTDADGKFTLFTYETGDGCPAGQYKVGLLVIRGDDEGADQVKLIKSARFPDKYRDPEKSGLTATVETQSNVLQPFKLSSKP